MADDVWETGVPLRGEVTVDGHTAVLAYRER
jgi:hypothetical protein